MNTSRLEAFSDGVIAVAITLLALNLPLPPTATPHLATYLGRHWPSFAAFAVAFLTVGIVWINHHAMVRRIVAVDNTALFLNLLLLMTICALPFTTALMAEYLRSSHGENVAAAIWGGSFFVMASAFNIVQRYLMLAKRDLLDERMTPERRTAVLRRNLLGLLPYTVAIAGAALSPYITLVICFAVTAYYALPGTVEIDRLDQP